MPRTPPLHLSLIVLLLAGPAAAFENEPEGHGALTWGMNLQRVQLVHPDLKLHHAPQSTEGLTLALETHMVTGRQVLGFSDCELRFDFANDQLYRVGFFCPATVDAVLDELREVHGKPDLHLGNFVHWTSDRRAVSFNLTTAAFSYTDRRRDAAVQLAVLQAAMPGGLTPVEPPQPESPPPTTTQPSPRSGLALSPEASAALSPESLEMLRQLAELPPGWLEEEGRLETALQQLREAKTPEELVFYISNVSLFQRAEHVPLVAPYLTHQDEGVFEATAAALETIGGEASARALGSQLGAAATPSERKLRLIEALMVLRAEPATTTEMARGLGAEDVEVRREAAMTLAVISGPEVAPAVREALEREPDELTRRVFERTLEILTKPKEAEAPEAEAATGLSS